MCGIAGLYHRDTAKPVDPARVRAMTDRLAHRGPDGAGVWTAPGVGLGHRRLSIIDLATGDQPMLSADGRLVLVFNGEIYNFREVRAELQALGHVFATASDTEVILHGWRQWGPSCLDRFDGMFAFALHDAEAGCLFLARDRLGVKPLHFAELADGTLLFASELKGLLAHPRLRREADPLAVEDYLAWGYVPDETCLVAGVRKLAAGHFLLVRRGLPLPAPIRWWDVSFADRARGSVAALEEELGERLRAAVRSRMVADVPLGAFLSGGVDSSAVVALMAEASPEAVETCSIGFDAQGLDETRYATLVAERFATRHRSRIVAPDDFGLIDTLADVFDEPFADASALGTYRVAQLARERVTVALSGDGADEAFAGYRRHAFFAAEERVRRLVPGAVRRAVVAPLAARWPKLDWAPRPLRFKSTLEGIGAAPGAAYARAVGVTPPAVRAQLYAPGFARALGGYRAEARWEQTFATAPAQGALDRAQYCDLKLWLPGDILTKVDRTSMAVGLEAREPLLDHRLVQFAATLPPSLRLRHGQGKWLMKRALRSHLPDEILYRRKMGFVTPISAWFRGPLAGAAASLGRSEVLGGTGWFDMAEIARLAEAHRDGREEQGRLLWQLVMLEKALPRLFGA